MLLDFQKKNATVHKDTLPSQIGGEMFSTITQRGVPRPDWSGALRPWRSVGPNNISTEGLLENARAAGAYVSPYAKKLIASLGQSRGAEMSQGDLSISICPVSKMGFSADFPPTTDQVWSVWRCAGLLCPWKTALHLLPTLHHVAPGNYFWVGMEPEPGDIPGLYRVFGLERDADGTPALYAYAMTSDSLWPPFVEINAFVLTP